MAILKKYPVAVLLFIGILVFFCQTYYHDMLFRYPYGIHDWAQSDRFSLAMNFYDNGMNFFKPATNNLLSKDGVVGVEFPIQAYLAASLGHIFGRGNISICFRLLDTIISCTGLLFLFLACFKATKDFIFSIVPPLFIFCSPLFIFYTCNYMPDTAATSICFIALYFILDFLKTPTSRIYTGIVCLLTLAALIKTSTGLYLVGFLLFVLIQRLRFYKQYSLRQGIWFSAVAVCSVALLVGEMRYNQYLNTKYDSTLFLARANPFSTWDDVIKYFNFNFKFIWLDRYFVLPQYLFLITLIATSFLFLRTNIKGKAQLNLALVFFVGALCLFYLFGKQFYDHDYYFLPVFFPLIAFMLVIGIIAIHNNIGELTGLRAVRVTLLSSIIIIFLFADFKIHRILTPNDGTPIAFTMPWCEGGDTVLKKLHISKNEPILAINTYAPNLVLMYMDRKGYIIPPDWLNDHIYEAVFFMHKKKLRIMVCDAAKVRQLEIQEKDIFKDYQSLYRSDKIAVFRLIGEP